MTSSSRRIACVFVLGTKEVELRGKACCQVPLPVSDRGLNPSSQLLRVDCMGCCGCRDEKQALSLWSHKESFRNPSLPMSLGRPVKPESATRVHTILERVWECAYPWKGMRMCLNCLWLHSYSVASFSFSFFIEMPLYFVVLWLFSRFFFFFL